MPTPRLLLTPLVLALLTSVLTAGAQTRSSSPPTPAASAPAATCPPLLQHQFDRLQDEKPQSLCQYAGKVLLVVNTASYCGFTGQYKGLEALYAKYREQGLVVLGFPSNDFAQEMKNSQDIAAFCENTFGVRFPMFTPSAVRGSDASAFYRQLASEAGQAPRWNFHKYLVSRTGQVVGSFGSTLNPESDVLRAAIEKQLSTPR